MTVAFQGELGAFSEEAVRAVFGAAELAPQLAFEDVFEALEAEAVDRAVVPIENSLFGSVHVNYDLLRTHAVQIVGELNLRIRHHLMAVSGAALGAIQAVVSHPQALGQCRQFLRRDLPDAAPQPTYDTAGAARAVAETGDPTRAAIASQAAAARYGLDVLAAEIEDDAQNFTRFLVLARAGEHVEPPAAPSDEGAMRTSGAMKTSIAFALRDNVPGALFKSLAVFALRELDLFKIESRPWVGKPGRYVFYLDVEGARTDDALANAIGHLREITASLNVLGSYPQAALPTGA